LEDLSRHMMLPADSNAVLVGRVDLGDGPTPILLRNGTVFDLSGVAPTVSDLFERADPAALTGTPLFSIADLLDRIAAQDPARPVLLAPIDLQVIKAAGVTFAVSALERVIEEAGRAAVSGRAPSRSAGEGRWHMPSPAVRPSSRPPRPSLRRCVYHARGRSGRP
jgi:fumarylacetoacetate (FAA) hydrolase family protein